MVCSIFMASSQTNGWPALTASPTAAPTRMTLPGMAAISEPCSTADPGSGNRGKTIRWTGPRGEST